MSCHCQVSFALLIRHVFQVLIITVFMLITSTAPSAKFHTHKHQLPSLFFKSEVTAQSLGHSAVQGRCRHRACVVQPCAGAAPRSPGMSPRAGPEPDSSALAHSALRGHTGTAAGCPGHRAEMSLQSPEGPSGTRGTPRSSEPTAAPVPLR